MNKFMKSLLITGIVASNATAVLATTPQNVRVLEQRVATSATLKAEQASVNYSNFIKNGGGQLWVNLTLEGAQFNTNDPYKIKDAITQNYDIETTLAVGNDGKSIEVGVYKPNAGIEYINNWEITIDSSVLTCDNDVTIKIPVLKDMPTVNTPKVITDKQSITVKELEEGFILNIEGINGAYFNTGCLGGFIRKSIMRTSNIAVNPIPYCDGLNSTKVKLHIKSLNPVPYYRDVLEFRIEGEATNSPVPLLVSLPIIR